MISCGGKSAKTNNAEIAENTELNQTENNSVSEQSDDEQSQESSQIHNRELEKIGFLDFLKKFTSSRETQISLIHSPFKFTVFDDDMELATKNWNTEQINANWGFLERKFFYSGKKEDEITGEITVGKWKIESDNTIIYTLSGDGWGLSFNLLIDIFNPLRG
jgi:hypothetical protein